MRRPSSAPASISNWMSVSAPSRVSRSRRWRAAAPSSARRRERCRSATGPPGPLETVQPSVAVVWIGGRYFESLGVQVQRGRGFHGSGWRRRVMTPPIVNQRFADAHFANADPLGQRIRLSQDKTGSATAAVAHDRRRLARPSGRLWRRARGRPSTSRSGLTPEPVRRILAGRVAEPATLAPLLRRTVASLDASGHAAQRQTVERAPRRLPPAAASGRHGALRVRHDCLAAVDGWSVRDDRLRGAAANPRDRRTDGARRTASSGRLVVRPPQPCCRSGSASSSGSWAPSSPASCFAACCFKPA